MGISSLGLFSKGGAVRQDGSFEIRGVAPGSYTLTGSANLDNRTLAVRMPLQVGGSNVEGLQITIRPGVTVKGKLRIEGRPQAEVGGFNVGLQPAEGGGVILGNVPSGKTEPDGTFALEEVGADRYDFYVTGLPNGHYLKSVRSGGVDVIANGLDASAGAAPLEVLVSPNAGGLEGTVMDARNNKPAAAAIVALVPRLRDRLNLYRSAEVDSSGRFRLKNLVPGEYQVYAWEVVPQTAWIDTD